MDVPTCTPFTHSIIRPLVHALYHGHRIVRRVVAVCYVFELAGIAVGLALSLPGVTFDNLCVVVGVPPTLIIYG